MHKKRGKKEKILTQLDIDPSVLNSEGVLSFEELDPSEFKILLSKSEESNEINEEEEVEEQGLDEYLNTELEETPKKKKKKQKKGNSKESEKIEQVYEDLDMSKWNKLGIHQKVISNLKKLQFSQPTPIQEAVIPKAIQRKDILASSETGSGKTLCFGIPIISNLLTEQDLENKEFIQEEQENNEEENNEKQQQQEEENIQEEEEEQQEEENNEEEKEQEEEEEQQEEENNEEEEENNEQEEEENKEEEKIKKNNSSEKKKFLRCLILTPTRELALQISKHIKPIIQNTNIKIAECVGGMSTEKQERLLKNEPEIVIGTTGRIWDIMKQNHSHLTNFKKLSYFVLDEADRMIADGHFPELKEILTLITERRKGKKGNLKIQNIVCSATLTLPSKFKKVKKSKNKEEDQKSIDQLMNMIHFQNNPEIIDLTTSNLVAKKLVECQIQCLEEDRLFYAYYFIYKYPGRTMIFINSIGVARHIYSTLQLLKVPVTILHGELQQKQRLKNLDKFLKDKNHVLITTDIASRGIDIKGVDHVIHYDLPKSPDIYVHRCGRTARAFSEGLSLALVSPQDKKHYFEICKATNKQNGIDQFPLDTYLTRDIRERIRLAKNIENILAKHKKTKSNASWFVKNAEELDIEIDEHFFPKMKKDSERELNDKQLRKMQNQLNDLLEKDLKSKKLVSKKYITMEPENIDYLKNSENPDAKKDLVQKKRKRKIKE